MCCSSQRDSDGIHGRFCQKYNCRVSNFPVADSASTFLASPTELFLTRQEDSIESDDDNASDNAGEGSGSGGGSGGSSRPKSTGTLASSGSSRGTSSGLLMPADVEEAVKREIETATGSRLAQVGFPKKNVQKGFFQVSRGCGGGYFPR